MELLLKHLSCWPNYHTYLPRSGILIFIDFSDRQGFIFSDLLQQHIQIYSNFHVFQVSLP